MKKLLLLFSVLLVSMGMRAEIIYTVVPEGGTKLETVPDNVTFTFTESVTVETAYIIFGRGNSNNVTEQITVKTGTVITVPIPPALIDEILENGFFMVSLMDGSNDTFAMVQYEIATPMNTFESQKIVPENNSTVESLSVITLTYGVAGTGFGNEGISIGGIDQAKEKVQLYQRLNPTPVATGTITVSEDYMDIIVTLDKTITENGVYTLIIPEATVYDDQADLTDDGYVDLESEFIQYVTYNPAVTLTYLVEVQAPQNTLSLKEAAPEDNAIVESLSTITLTYGKQGSGLADPGVFISGIDASKKDVQLLGRNNAVATNGVISVVDELSIKITLDAPVTSDGVYTLTIPEATVYDDQADFIDWENSYVDVDSEFTKEATYNPEVTLTYTIVHTSINTIQAIPAGEVSIYSIQGVLLRKGDAAVVLNGLVEGIYIVNGQKVVISK